MNSVMEQFTEFKDSFVGTNASFSSLACDGGSVSSRDGVIYGNWTFRPQDVSLPRGYW